MALTVTVGKLADDIYYEIVSRADSFKQATCKLKITEYTPGHFSATVLAEDAWGGPDTIARIRSLYLNSFRDMNFNGGKLLQILRNRRICR